MKQNEFFGSKLNSVLLLVLIILMIIAIKIMLRNEKEYLGVFQKQVPVVDTTQEIIPTEVRNNISGNKDDLISFSIWPNTKVRGVLSYRGIIKGGYFFEANILINILDSNKKIIKQSNAMAKDDWMTAGPVNFEGNIDFSGLLKGPAYFEIHNDNASGLPENDKSILIPIIIE
ncbi:MAG: Gmad2 immunoglobulin-like domain-containing protein [Candidatus Paceibacterota bacterium]|jgi:hypothetical protein